MNQPERQPKPRYEIGPTDLNDNALERKISQTWESWNRPELSASRKKAIARDLVHLTFEQGFRKKDSEPFYEYSQMIAEEFLPKSEVAQVTVAFDQAKVQDSETPAS